MRKLFHYFTKNWKLCFGLYLMLQGIQGLIGHRGDTSVIGLLCWVGLGLGVNFFILDIIEESRRTLTINIRQRLILEDNGCARVVSELDD